MSNVFQEIEIFRPCKTNHLSQEFGENRACINPITGKVVTRTRSTCPQGYKGLYQHYGMDGHNGEDWSLGHGETVFFPVRSNLGWWAKDASDTDGGLGVDVISKQKIRLKNKRTGEEREHYIKFRFWHALEAWKDKDVEFGEPVMLGDNTGRSSGDHVHWSMKFCDKEGNTFYRDNGYYGGQDFREWIKFTNMFVGDVKEVRQIQLSLINSLKKLVSLLRIKLKMVSN